MTDPRPDDTTSTLQRSERRLQSLRRRLRFAMAERDRIFARLDALTREINAEWDCMESRR